MSSEPITCPGCNASDGFRTSERVIASSEVTTLEYVDGEIKVNYSGTSENGDEFETIGIRCQHCGWEHDGPPAGWPEVFFPTPDVSAILATRERMLRRNSEGDTP